jgi:Flp pilus assembly protein TadB
MIQKVTRFLNYTPLLMTQSQKWWTTLTRCWKERTNYKILYRIQRPWKWGLVSSRERQKKVKNAMLWRLIILIVLLVVVILLVLLVAVIVLIAVFAGCGFPSFKNCGGSGGGSGPTPNTTVIAGAMNRV